MLDHVTADWLSNKLLQCGSVLRLRDGGVHIGGCCSIGDEVKVMTEIIGFGERLTRHSQVKESERVTEAGLRSDKSQGDMMLQESEVGIKNQILACQERKKPISLVRYR